MKIWNGLSSTRDDMLVRKSPDGEDWRTITRELQTTQEFLVNLASNADAMPDLVSAIRTKQREVSSLQAAIAGLSPPEDVKEQVDKLAEEMVKLHGIYTHAAEVLQTVNFLQRQLLNLGRRIDEHVQKTDKSQLAFKNQFNSWQRIHEDRWDDRLKKAEEQLGAISLALGLKKFGE